MVQGLLFRHRFSKKEDRLFPSDLPFVLYDEHSGGYGKSVHHRQRQLYGAWIILPQNKHFENNEKRITVITILYNAINQY
jgi:hypothetical protein